uniref:Uncharacterized protein n=1 Tax=Phlebotomus papatasi TaxID=29031 RepID=A0A1B0DHP1_PHLPP
MPGSARVFPLTGTKEFYCPLGKKEPLSIIGLRSQSCLLVITAKEAAALAVEEGSKVAKSAEEQAKAAAGAARQTASNVSDTVENTKKQAASMAEQTQKAANDAINQGLKTAEQEIDNTMKATSTAVDQKLQEANKYADEKRVQLEKKVNEEAAKAQESAGNSAANLLGKLNLGASLKSLGEKTASLFDRKKKDAETLAAEKAATAQKMAEEQVKKAGEAVGQTRSEAENLAASTGLIN